MYYLYDEKKKLKPLRLNAQDAVGIAQFCNAILVSNRIEEMILIAGYQKSAFFIYSKNKLSLFRYCLLQIKNHTLNEFRIIITDQKSWFYYLLKSLSLLSFGYYQLLLMAKKEQINIPFKSNTKKIL